MLPARGLDGGMLGGGRGRGREEGRRVVFGDPTDDNQSRIH